MARIECLAKGYAGFTLCVDWGQLFYKKAKEGNPKSLLSWIERQKSKEDDDEGYKEAEFRQTECKQEGFENEFRQGPAYQQEDSQDTVEKKHTILFACVASNETFASIAASSISPGPLM